MLFQTAEKFLSPARLTPYLAAAKGNEQSCLRLYFDNLRLAQSFYIPLSLLEVAFRNALHDVLSVRFGSENWLLLEQTGFMVDARLKGNNKALSMVEKASREFEKRQLTLPSHGLAIVADLEFGFWTTLFTHRYFFTVMNQAPIRAFSHRPRGTAWDVVNTKIQEIRLFRNRVYHYEPLCFQPQVAGSPRFSQLWQMHGTIVELLSWLDPALPTWLAEADRVPDTLRTISKKYPPLAQ